MKVEERKELIKSLFESGQSEKEINEYLKKAWDLKDSTIAKYVNEVKVEIGHQVSESVDEEQGDEAQQEETSETSEDKDQDAQEDEGETKEPSEIQHVEQVKSLFESATKEGEIISTLEDAGLSEEKITRIMKRAKRAIEREEAEQKAKEQAEAESKVSKDIDTHVVAATKAIEDAINNLELARKSARKHKRSPYRYNGAQKALNRICKSLKR